jgi:hypothetical protein
MKKYLLLFVLSFISSNLIFAQTSKSDPSDTQGWFGASCTFDLPKKWEVYSAVQSRFVNNINDYNGTYITFGGIKKLNKHFELLGDYRLALVRAGVYNRFTIGAEASRKIKKLNISFRFQLQNQLQDFDDTAKSNDNSGYWRTRFAGKYAFSKKLEAYISFEPIMKFRGVYFIDNIRNTIGLKYKVNHKLKIDCFYIYRPDYAKSYNRVFHIIGCNADYTIKKKKKKTKK